MSTYVKVICDQCHEECSIPLNKFNRNKKLYDKIFCSVKCQHKFKSDNGRVHIKCALCGKEKTKTLSQFNKTKRHFCSSSCAATYNNQHKTKGTRRSKLEVWLESKLPIIYPQLEIHFNKKDAIESELDIYIPSLALAFELNGIVHYEPIYGALKLGKIQNNDDRKFLACFDNGIDLCVIDSSGLKYFKEANCIKYLDIVTRIIDSRMKK
jgi:hypothetical protein